VRKTGITTRIQAKQLYSSKCMSVGTSNKKSNPIYLIHKLNCNTSSLFRYAIFLVVVLLSVAKLMFLMRTGTLPQSTLAKMEEMFAGLPRKIKDSTPDPPSGKTKEAGDVQERSHSALPPIFDQVINATEEAERCHRYGYGYDRTERSDVESL
jgi:hypothetical protein